MNEQAHKTSLRVGIVGAGGFIGRSVACYLAGQGHSVSRLPRVPEASLAAYAAGELPVGDAFPPSRDGGNELDAIVNCAGKPQRRGDDAGRALVYQRLPELVYRHCLESGIGCFVHLSSVAAVTSVTWPGKPADDATPPAPQTEYGHSKLAADARLLAIAEKRTRLVILRPPIVFGPGAKGVFALLARCAAARIPLPIASLDNRRDFIFIDNLASAVEASLLGANVRNAYIVTDADPVTPGRFYNALAEGANSRPLAWKFPTRLLTPLARLLLGGRASSLLDNAAYDSRRFRRDARWLPQIDFLTATTLAMKSPRAV